MALAGYWKTALKIGGGLVGAFTVVFGVVSFLFEDQVKQLGAKIGTVVLNWLVTALEWLVQDIIVTPALIITAAVSVVGVIACVYLLLKRQIAGLNRQHAELSGQNAQLIRENGEFSERNTELGGQNADLNKQNAELSRQNSEFSGQNAQLSRQNLEVSERNAELRGQNADLHKQIAEFSRQNAELTLQNAELSRQSADLASKVGMDRLTGVPSLEGLESRFIRARERSTTQPLIMVLVDIVAFREMNNRYGQAGGDILLTAFASYIGGQLRGALGTRGNDDAGPDAICRVGGDEFIVLFANMDVNFAARRIGEFQDALIKKKSYALQENYSSLPFYAGITDCPASETLDSCRERVSEELVKAKKKSRKEWELHREETELLKAQGKDPPCLPGEISILLASERKRPI